MTEKQTEHRANLKDEPPKGRAKKERQKIVFKLTPLRLWQIIAAVACVFAIVFCSLWLQARQAEQAMIAQLEEMENIPPIEVDEEIQQQVEETTQPDNADWDVSEVSIKGKRIIIDPGHGGNVPGGTTGVSGKREKDVNLEISKKLQAMLQENGAEVIMTREEDVALGETWELDMQARENVILESEADMFLSIHQNEFEDPEAKGPQVFFVAQGSIGKKLAVCLQDMINHEMDVEMPRIPLEAPYRVLKPGTQPSSTIECGFMSNPEEDLLLQDEAYQNKMAKAIMDGVKLYVKKYG